MVSNLAVVSNLIVLWASWLVSFGESSGSGRGAGFVTLGEVSDCAINASSGWSGRTRIALEKVCSLEVGRLDDCSLLAGGRGLATGWYWGKGSVKRNELGVPPAL